jgi:hypothetical protein
MRWLERYITEGSPKLKHFSELAGDLARRLGDDYAPDAETRGWRCTPPNRGYSRLCSVALGQAAPCSYFMKQPRFGE